MSMLNFEAFICAGSAIYAFFIIANAIPNGTALTSLTFELDGSQVGSFTNTAMKGSDYLYDVPGYVNTSIPNGPHQLDIIASGASASIVLFDYAVYTYVQVLHLTRLDKTNTFVSLVLMISRLLCNVETFEILLPLSVLSSEYCC